MNKKTAAMLLALVLMIGVAAGGSLAWLTAKVDPVVNTFTTSDINIELVETKDEDAQTAGNQFKMIPGYTIEKDPKVTVLTDSEVCWLFVEVKKSETTYTVGTETKGFDDYLTYTIADGWTTGDGTSIPKNVVYRKIEATNIGTAYSVLKDDKVTVKDEVTKAMMEAAKTNQPTLTFTAYASQLMKDNKTEFTAAEAWANINAK